MSEDNFKISFRELLFQVHFMEKYFDEVTLDMSLEDFMLWIANELDEAASNLEETGALSEMQESSDRDSG